MLNNLAETHRGCALGLYYSITSYVPAQLLDKFFACIILAILYFLCSSLLPHHPRQFFERDPDLSYIFDGDQVPTLWLFVISLSISYGILFLTLFVNNITFAPKRFARLHMGMLHFCDLTAALLAASSTTEILKCVISRPRPSFYYLCNYRGYTDAVTTGNFTSYFELTTPNTFGSIDNCLENDLSVLRDAISSFPSGHASLSFAAMWCSSLFLLKMFGISQFHSVRGILCFSPLIISSWIAVTRVQDMKHREDDIIGGFLVGTFSALICCKDVLLHLNKMRRNLNQNEGLIDENCEPFIESPGNNLYQSSI